MLLNIEQPHRGGLRFGALTEVITTAPTASLPTEFVRGQPPFPLSFQGCLAAYIVGLNFGLKARLLLRKSADTYILK